MLFITIITMMTILINASCFSSLHQYTYILSLASSFFSLQLFSRFIHFCHHWRQSTHKKTNTFFCLNKNNKQTSILFSFCLWNTFEERMRKKKTHTILSEDRNENVFFVGIINSNDKTNRRKGAEKKTWTNRYDFIRMNRITKKNRKQLQRKSHQTVNND